jgi:uncharacterized damage-inducible protein DinB
MSEKRLLQRLFAYDDWANGEVLSVLRGVEKRVPGSLRWISHILAAEEVWLSRLRRDGAKPPVWPDRSLENCRAMAENLRNAWRDLLDSTSEQGLAQPVNYTNSKGEAFSSTVGDILMHVAMHSAYHRGQIAADMRAAGVEPVYTDFIHAVRQGKVRDDG